MDKSRLSNGVLPHSNLDTNKDRIPSTLAAPVSTHSITTQDSCTQPNITDSNLSHQALEYHKCSSMQSARNSVTTTLSSYASNLPESLSTEYFKNTEHPNDIPAQGISEQGQTPTSTCHLHETSECSFPSADTDNLNALGLQVNKAVASNEHAINISEKISQKTEDVSLSAMDFNNHHLRPANSLDTNTLNEISCTDKTVINFDSLDINATSENNSVEENEVNTGIFNQSGKAYTDKSDSIDKYTSGNYCSTQVTNNNNENLIITSNENSYCNSNTSKSPSVTVKKALPQTFTTECGEIRLSASEVTPRSVAMAISQSNTCSASNHIVSNRIKNIKQDQISLSDSITDSEISKSQESSKSKHNTDQGLRHISVDSDTKSILISRRICHNNNIDQIKRQKIYSNGSRHSTVMEPKLLGTVYPQPILKSSMRSSLQGDINDGDFQMNLSGAQRRTALRGTVPVGCGLRSSIQSDTGVTGLNHQGQLRRKTVTDEAGERVRSSSVATARSSRRSTAKESISLISNVCVEYLKHNGGMGPMRPLRTSRASSLPDPSLMDRVGPLVGDVTDMRRNAWVNQRNRVTPASGQINLQQQHFQKLKEPPSFSLRHSKRNELFSQRKTLSDYALVFGLVGIALMIVETELVMAKVYSKESIYSVAIKSAISLSTVILMGIMIAYHRLEIMLFAVNNCIDDWRIALNGSMLVQIICELTICALHPPPGLPYFTWTSTLSDGVTISRARVPLDLLLSLPMFLRLYLIFRSMMLHSMLFSDAASRSIGALNRISFNTWFVLKTLMTMYPGTVLLVVMLTLCAIASWTLRACESYHEQQFGNLFNTMWFTSITFLSIGYGDIVPNTYCGRAIAISTGIMGSFCTALVVAVLAQKMELTRAEKFVHNFMMDNQLTKRMKHAAANILRETWLTYKYTKLVKKPNAARVRSIQKKFLTAIHSLRNVKMQLKALNDETNSLLDFSQTQNGLYELLADVASKQAEASENSARMDEKLNSIQDQMDRMWRLLRRSHETRTSFTDPAVPPPSNTTSLHRPSLVTLGGERRLSSSVSVGYASLGQVPVGHGPAVKRILQSRRSFGGDIQTSGLPPSSSTTYYDGQKYEIFTNADGDVRKGQIVPQDQLGSQGLIVSAPQSFRSCLDRRRTSLAEKRGSGGFTRGRRRMSLACYPDYQLSLNTHLEHQTSVNSDEVSQAAGFSEVEMGEASNNSRLAVGCLKEGGKVIGQVSSQVTGGENINEHLVGTDIVKKATQKFDNIEGKDAEQSSKISTDTVAAMDIEVIKK